MKGFGDPARRIVFCRIQRFAIHDRARVRLCMVIGGKRDRAERFLPHAMFVHVAADSHGKALRRRQHTVRHQIRLFARDGVDTRRLPETAILALSQ